MIDIKRKEDCVACNGCVQKCPKQCISMHEDEQGFLYPKIDLEKCIDCHLCEKVCPVINQNSTTQPIHTYAAKNNDNAIQDTSSSGGIFYALVEYVINNNGVVFGARFNKNWEVVHDYAETLDEAKAFKESKYVQSRMNTNFHKVEEFLNTGRIVLFSGTPCQVAALKLFLRKDWSPQLLTVDVVCHGVPSPMVWRKYLRYILYMNNTKVGKNSDFQSDLNDMPVITGISFRNKHQGWQKYGFSVRSVARKGDKNTDFQSAIRQNEEQLLLFETHDRNIYMQGFLHDLYLRPSCYDCPAKCGKSHSDITLADFWGIDKMNPQLYQKKYYSLVLSNSINGDKLLQQSRIKKEETDYSMAVSSNHSIIDSARKPKESEIFWKLFPKHGIPIIPTIVRGMKPSFFKRVCRFTHRKLIKVLKAIGITL